MATPTNRIDHFDTIREPEFEIREDGGQTFLVVVGKGDDRQTVDSRAYRLAPAQVTAAKTLVSKGGG